MEIVGEYYAIHTGQQAPAQARRSARAKQYVKVSSEKVNQRFKTHGQTPNRNDKPKIKRGTRQMKTNFGRKIFF
jgi:hypothetical protein